MPEVSVIIPAHNCEPFIEQAVLSICRQTERDLEIIVVDDGSTDNTRAIAEQLAASESRIVVISREHSGKPSVARNVGLARCKGQYVAFLDADDVCDPQRIARELAVFERFPEVDIVFHDFKKFADDPHGDSEQSHLETLNFKQRAERYLTGVGGSTYLCAEDFYAFLSLEIPVVSTCAVMFRKTLLARVGGGFREDLTIGEDYDLWLRLAMGRRMAFIDEVLSYYRQRPGTLTKDQERMWTEGIVVHADNLKRGADFFAGPKARRYRQKIARYWFHLGVFYFRCGRVGEARSAYRRSMALAPAVKTVAAYLKTLAPRWVVRSYRRSRLGKADKSEAPR